MEPYFVSNIKESFPMGKIQATITYDSMHKIRALYPILPMHGGSLLSSVRFPNPGKPGDFPIKQASDQALNKNLRSPTRTLSPGQR